MRINHTTTAARSWRRTRLALLAVCALMPAFARRWCYRTFFRYQIGRNVTIGMSLLDADHVVLAPGTQIGHFNVVTRVGSCSRPLRMPELVI